MKKATTILRKILCGVAACALLAPLLASNFAVHAEGSKDLTENGGYRPYTERYGMETAGEARDQIIYVYLQAGETVYFGDSVRSAQLGYTNEKMGTNLTADELAKLNSTDILVTTPAWNESTNPHSYPYVNGVRDNTVLLYDTADNATAGTQGYIANPAQEAAGPAIGGSTGYNPYSITATQSGIYRFKFYSQKHNIVNPKVVKTDAAWDQKGSCVAAWDTTVVSASGSVIEGRTFTDTLFLNMGNNVNIGGVLKAAMFAVTDDGYQYKVDFNGMDPYGFVFFANNRGLLRGGNTVSSLYHSVRSDNNQLSDLQNHGVVLNNIPTDATLDHTYKLFFNQPDDAALRAIGVPTVTTGSNGISNFAFTGNSTTAGVGYVGLGGVFSFDADANISATSYQIELHFGTDNTVYLGNTLQAGRNTITWDGLDATGAPVPAGTYNTGTVKMQVKGGEVHFPLMDVENNVDGIKVTRLNGEGAPDTTVYYNNSASNAGDTSAPWTIAKNWTVADKLDATAGVDSANGAMKYTSRAGDQTALDVWAYYNQSVDLHDYEFLLQNTTFTATKVWEGDYPTRPAQVDITLYNDRGATVGTATLSEGDAWAHTWTELDPARTYYVRETAVPGCTTTYGEVQGNMADGYTQQVTNTMNYTSVTVVKLWDHGDNAPADYPADLSVSLCNADNTVLQTATLDGDGGWTHTWTGLDPTITYTVQETAPLGYTPSQTARTGNSAQGYRFTLLNSFDTANFATVAVAKDWQNVPEGCLPESISVQLTSADGQPVTADGEGNPIDPVAQLNSANGWTAMWSLLDPNVTYAVQEVNTPAGFTCQNSGLQMIGGNFYFGTLTNTYVPTTFTVTKQWENGVSPLTSYFYDAVNMGLQQSIGGAPYIDYGAPVDVQATDDWQYTWSDLPSYDKDGNAIRYRVYEEAVPGYRAVYNAVQGDAGSGYSQTVTNVYLYTNLTVQKTWQFGAQAEDDRPQILPCSLYTDGALVITRNLTANDGWSLTFHDLPAAHADGIAIQYTVQEDTPQDYAATGGTVNGTATGGYTAAFTNTYTGTPPTSSSSSSGSSSSTSSSSQSSSSQSTAPSSSSQSTSASASNTAPTSPSSGSSTIPRTGDASVPALWLLATLCALTGLSATILYHLRRRKQY